VAVATKPTNVGTVTSWAGLKVGATATQANANFFNGARGLELLRRETPAEEVVRRLPRADRRRDERQLCVVDRRGTESTALLVVHREPWCERTRPS
jgi:uncharacterized Ntn-hydrolase superfamily protein